MTWLDVFGWIGSGILVWSLLQTRILRLRALNLTGCVISGIYALLAGIWPILGLNAVLALINLYHLRKLVSQAANETSYTVISVAPGDSYFKFLLTKHALDIASTHPDFTDPAPGSEAFIILHNDETVGMVVLELDQATSGVAHIQLDFVTPRFRDFSPGRYLFQDSGLLNGRGLNRIVTRSRLNAPTMKYYRAIGFVPVDDHAELLMSG